MNTPLAPGAATPNDVTAVGTPCFRHVLPYGSVMASAGAAVLAPVCGLGALTVPLLLFTVAQAVWIAVVGALFKHNWGRHPWSWLAAIRTPKEHCGAHTVPLGLAIVAGALASLTAAGGRLLVPIELVWALLALTWLASLICLVQFGSSLFLRPWKQDDVDGAWFLVPAVALGAAIATAEAAADMTGTWAATLTTIAVLATAFGWIGYWLIALAAAKRICRCGLGPSPRAPWWIAMGCAGLSAAAVGKVLGAAAWPPIIDVALRAALLTAAVAAVILMLPIVVFSIWFLLRDCRFRNSTSWPPTFSTAVFALGCLAAWATAGWVGFRILGTIGAFVTLGLWLTTFLWNAARAFHSY